MEAWVLAAHGPLPAAGTRFRPPLQELDDPVLSSLSHAYVGDTITMLKRIENEGEGCGLGARTERLGLREQQQRDGDHASGLPTARRHGLCGP